MAVKGEGQIMTTLIVLLAISLVIVAVGMAWTLALKGHTTRRTGADVGAEYLEEEMARRSLRAGKTSVGRKVWFRGKGWAMEREAAISYKELKTMWRARSFGAVLPMGLLLLGMVSSIILGGLLMLTSLDNPIPGLFILAIGIYTAWLIVAGIRRA